MLRPCGSCSCSSSPLRLPLAVEKQIHPRTFERRPRRPQSHNRRLSQSKTPKTSSTSCSPTTSRVNTAERGSSFTRGHQAVVSRSKFDECVGTGFPSGVEFEGVDVEEVYDEPIDVPRIPEKTSKAVTLTLRASAGGETERDTDTYHLIDVGGRWAWILETQDVAAYERGECPP